MGTLYKVIAGIGTLIAVYLFLSNATETTSIIRALGSQSNSAIRTLQGR